MFCAACGADLKAPSREIAGFWQRVGASLIDGLILFPVGLVLARFGLGATQSPGYFEMRELGLIISMLISACYRFLLEASVWQGTVGKRATGLQVTDLAGARLSLAQSLKREGCRQIISLAGNLTVFFTSYQAMTLLGLVSLVLEIVDLAWMGRTSLRQTLHDQMAGTLVYHKIAVAQPNSTPQFPSIGQ